MRWNYSLLHCVMHLNSGCEVKVANSQPYYLLYSSLVLQFCNMLKYEDSRQHINRKPKSQVQFVSIK